jgi:hypothetical protein
MHSRIFYLRLGHCPIIGSGLRLHPAFQVSLLQLLALARTWPDRACRLWHFLPLCTLLHAVLGPLLVITAEKNAGVRFPFGPVCSPMLATSILLFLIIWPLVAALWVRIMLDNMVIVLIRVAQELQRLRWGGML